MASSVFADFGSTAQSVTLAANEFHVRGIQAPQGGSAIITSVTAFLRNSVGPFLTTTLAASLRVIRLTATSPGQIIPGWQDAFATGVNAQATTLVATRVRNGLIAHFTFDPATIIAQRGEVLYVACGACLTDGGVGNAGIVDLAVNGFYGSDRVEQIRLR